MLKDLPFVLEQIRNLSFPSTTDALLQVGEDNDEELNRKVCEAVELSGGGHISLEKYDGTEVVCEHTESYMTDVIYSDHTTDRVLKGSMVAIFNDRLTYFSEVQECMELSAGTFAGRPLLIVTPMASKEVKGGVIQNDKGGVVECVVIEVPRVTWASGWLEDLASYTGATLFDSKLFSEFDSSMFGSAKEITLQTDKMVIDPYEDHIDRTADRADFLLSEARSIPHPHTQDLWRKRASALVGSLVRVKVGGVTDSEARVRRNNAEKVILSMSDLYLNGYVEGAIPTLADLKCESYAMERALKSPFRVLCHNLNTYTEDPSVLSVAKHPFPTGRLCTLIEKSVSIAETLSIVEMILPPTK